MQPSKADKLTVYYDGQCPLCRREVALYRRLDRRHAIHWHDVSQDAGDLADDGLTQREALDRIHARSSDGTIVSGAKAFVAIWERLPGFAWFAPLVRSDPMLSILERGYSWFAPRRHRLSRLLGGQ